MADVGLVCATWKIIHSSIDYLLCLLVITICDVLAECIYQNDYSYKAAVILIHLVPPFKLAYLEDAHISWISFSFHTGNAVVSIHCVYFLKLQILVYVTVISKA